MSIASAAAYKPIPYSRRPPRARECVFHWRPLSRLIDRWRLRRLLRRRWRLVERCRGVGDQHGFLVPQMSFSQGQPCVDHAEQGKPAFSIVGALSQFEAFLGIQSIGLHP